MSVGANCHSSVGCGQRDMANSKKQQHWNKAWSCNWQCTWVTFGYTQVSAQQAMKSFRKLTFLLVSFLCKALVLLSIKLDSSSSLTFFGTVFSLFFGVALPRHTPFQFKLSSDNVFWVSSTWIFYSMCTCRYGLSPNFFSLSQAMTPPLLLHLSPSTANKFSCLSLALIQCIYEWHCITTNFTLLGATVDVVI